VDWRSIQGVSYVDSASIQVLATWIGQVYRKLAMWIRLVDRMLARWIRQVHPMAHASLVTLGRIFECPVTLAPLCMSDGIH
jgi:hypothetical protein